VAVEVGVRETGKVAVPVGVIAGSRGGLGEVTGRWVHPMNKLITAMDRMAERVFRETMVFLHYGRHNHRVERKGFIP
jgi:hypothetical protein